MAKDGDILTVNAINSIRLEIIVQIRPIKRPYYVTHLEQYFNTAYEHAIRVDITKDMI